MEEKYKNNPHQSQPNHTNPNKSAKTNQKAIKIKALDVDYQNNSNQHENKYDDIQPNQKQQIKQQIIVAESQEKKKLTFSAQVDKNIQPKQQIINNDNKKVEKPANQAKKIQVDNKIASVSVQVKQQKVDLKIDMESINKKPAINITNVQNTTQRSAVKKASIHPQTPQIKSYKSIKNISYQQQQQKQKQKQQQHQQHQQTDNISRKTRQTFKSTRSSREDYLHQVFNYYCKLSYPLAKNPTFQQIDNTTKKMKMNNFMTFCRDFKIRQKVTRQKLVQVFNKHSYFHKFLKVQEFHYVVQDLADFMFEEYQEDRRFGKMLVFLEIHNSYKFVKKMNELGVIFRMKNKRGIQVNLTPKYTFKLTPNNGKSQQQIALQVKQRSQLRQLLKQQKMSWHRKNKLNKIDQLYKKHSQKKIISIKSLKKRSKYINSLNEQPNKQNNLLVKISLKQKHNQKQNSNQKYSKNKNKQVKSNTIPQKTCRGYYNPCQLLSSNSNQSYRAINQLKKKHYNSRIKQYYFDHDRKQALKSQYIRQSRQLKDYKVNNVIALARNTLKQQQINSLYQNSKISEQYGCIKKQNKQNLLVKFNHVNQQLAQSKYIPTTNAVSRVTHHNKYGDKNMQELRYQQRSIQQQLKNIPQTIYQSRVFSKQFLRSTAKLDKQNSKQLSQLEQMIDIKNQSFDQILEMHFNNQRSYEQKMVNMKAASF